MNAWYIAILVQVQVNEVFTLISNIVLFHGEVHVKWSIDSLPGVRSSMVVKLEVSVQDLVHGFFFADLDNIISFGQLVDDSDLTGLFRKLTTAKLIVSPPWSLEALWVPVAIWHHWWNM